MGAMVTDGVHQRRVTTDVDGDLANYFATATDLCRQFHDVAEFRGVGGCRVLLGGYEDLAHRLSALARARGPRPHLVRVDRAETCRDQSAHRLSLSLSGGTARPAMER